MSLMALLGATLVVLSFPNGTHPLVNITNQYLKTQGYDAVQIKSITSFFPLNLSLKPIDIDDPYPGAATLSQVVLTLDSWLLMTERRVQAQLSGKGQQFSPHALQKQTPKEIQHKNSVSLPFNFVFTTKGPLDNIQLNCNITAPHYQRNGIQLHDITLESQVTGLPSHPQGNIKADFIYNHKKGHVTIKAFHLKEDTLVVKDFSLKGLSATVTSDLSYHLKTSATKGHINLKVQDLKPLSTLIGYPLSGALTLRGDIKKDQSQAIASLSLQGTHLKNDDFSLASFSTTLKTHGILEAPTAHFEGQIQNFKSQGVTLEKITSTSTLKEGIGFLKLSGAGKELDFDINTALNLAKNQKEMTVKTFNAHYDKQPLKLLKPFDIHLTKETLRLSPATLQFVTFPLTIQGQKQGENLNFSLKGAADLGLLSHLFLYTGDRLQGLLHMDCHLTGTTTHPNLEGLIQLKNGGYENVLYGTKLHNLQVTATAQNDLLTLKNITAQDGYGGHMRLNATYNITKKFLDLQTHVTNMRLAYTDTLKVVARQGQIKAKGPTHAIHVTGALQMGDISYNLISALTSTVAELNLVDPENPQTLPKTPPQKSTQDFQMIFDVDIKSPRTVTIYGLGLESTWGGQLKVSKTLNNLLITGALTLDHGQLHFLSQNIHIEEGVLTFDGQEDNIPYVDLQGSFKTNNLKGIMALNGRASQPTFTFSSEPSLPKDEILSHLLFGSHSSQLSPFDAIRLAKIAAELAGIGSGQSFADMMKNQLAKKEKGADGAETQKKADALSKERLMDKVHIHMDQGVNATDSKVVVDINITDNITVSTEAGTAAASESVGLNYKIDY